ncbi:hypothetical protein B0H17DRAFT_1139014 [Mycena rosella]|uniref:Uncharacterized protein n=1 Tax=Mycena rosella TaxID=1033263 RepID=A0AAD7G907_MYCRO|nr:hypothetical protein B0H17DRAFT_1139014 [Mycena rosella]
MAQLAVEEYSARRDQWVPVGTVSGIWMPSPLGNEESLAQSIHLRAKILSAPSRAWNGKSLKCAVETEDDGARVVGGRGFDGRRAWGLYRQTHLKIWTRTHCEERVKDEEQDGEVGSGKAKMLTNLHVMIHNYKQWARTKLSFGRVSALQFSAH